MEEYFLNQNARIICNNADKLSASIDAATENQNALFLYKHNSSSIQKMLEFFESENKVFILKGYSGSGKSAIVDLLLKQYISDDVLLFKFLFQTATNLDDILLSIYKDFTLYAAKKKTILPKSDTIIFSEKVNAFIKSSFRPLLFIFDNIEFNYINQKKQDELCDFIKYLIKFPNIKIIICSRTLNPKDIKLDKFISLCNNQPFSEEETNSFLRQNNIEFSSEKFKRFFQVSGGNHIFLSMFIELLSVLDTKADKLFGEYENKKNNFPDYLLQSTLGLLSNKFLSLFYLLSLIRLGVSENFIISRNIAAKEDLYYLLDRGIISKEFGLYYFKDYFKTKYIKSISSDIQVQIYKELIRFYESLLPKKPFERDLLISRLTMRREIEYCKDSIELLMMDKKKKKIPTSSTNFEYLSYATMHNQDWSNQSGSLNPINIPEIQPEKQATFGKANLSKEDVNLLNLTSPKDIVESELSHIVQMSEKLTSNAHKDSSETESEQQTSPKDNFEDLIAQGKAKEKEFKYREAIEFYEKAFLLKDAPLYETRYPKIVFRTAFCYRRIQETEKAISLFEEASKLFSETNQEKSILSLLCIAQTYSEVYRFDEAKKAYNRVFALGDILPKDIFIRANLDLAEISDNNLNTENAAGYAYNALKTAETYDNKKLLTESYFKYALYNDDLGNPSLALKYYLKCIQTSQDTEENTFLSPAYSNLALLCAEQEDIQNAILYHNKAIETDEKIKNTEGLYFSYVKLAEIYKSQNYSKSYEYLIKALKTIRKSEDKTHLITVYIELGDCYYKAGNIKKAVKSYLLANKLITEHSKFEELYTLEAKIKNLKASIGEEEYMKYYKELRPDEN